jgi:hypothetical protein
MKRQNLCTTAIVVVMIVSFLITGCLGRFAAHNNLATWNQKATDNKWLNELIFLGLVIIPVYELAWLGDAIIFNSIEFWGGKNPMTSEGDYQKTVQAKDLKVVQSFHQDQTLKTMTADYYLKGNLTKTVILSQQAGSSEFDGISVAPNGTVENFKIEAGEANLTLTRFNAQGKPTIQVVQGPALESLSEKVAGLINSHTFQLASAH